MTADISFIIRHPDTLVIPQVLMYNRIKTGCFKDNYESLTLENREGVFVTVEKQN